LERFFRSAGTYRIKVPYHRKALAEGIRQAVLRNGFESCYVRPICYYGSDALALQPRGCPVEVALFA